MGKREEYESRIRMFRIGHLTRVFFIGIYKLHIQFLARIIDPNLHERY
jgi:hypothetical protein